MEELKLPDSVFLHGDVRSSVLKTQKNTKTRQTKTPVTKNFQIIRPIQGCTMSKSIPWAFQKCKTYGDGNDLTLTYGPQSQLKFQKKDNSWWKSSSDQVSNTFKLGGEATPNCCNFWLLTFHTRESKLNLLPHVLLLGNEYNFLLYFKVHFSTHQSPLWYLILSAKNCNSFCLRKIW